LIFKKKTPENMFNLQTQSGYGCEFYA